MCIRDSFKAYQKIISLYKTNSFNVVLTSFGPLTPHMIALRLRRNGYKFYWIAAMRDEMSKNILISRYLTKRLIPVSYTHLCRQKPYTS